MKARFLAFCAFLLLAVHARSQAPGSLEALNANIVGNALFATAVQPDGKIILAGDFISVLGVPRSNIARLNADGTLDTGFDPKANARVVTVAVQADGKILLGGNFISLQPNGAASVTARSYVARVNADGTLDTGFDPDPNGSVLGLAVQADGKVLLGGAFTTLQPNGASTPVVRQRMARVNADGTLDSGFDPELDGTVTSVAVQGDGKVVLAGSFTTLQPNGAATPTARSYVARVKADGTLDTGFDPHPSDKVSSVAVQADGKVLLGGSFTSLQPNGAATATVRQHVARLNADGTLDPIFDPRTNFDVYCLAVQADGKVLLGGQFSTLQPNGAATPTTRAGSARVNADGMLDLGFDVQSDRDVYSLALQADGKVLIGGIFTTLQPHGAAATARNHFARIYNDPATQTLATPDAATVRWARRGSGPAISGPVTFEQSTDGGTSYTFLGTALRVGLTESWELSGLTLPAGGLLRARGRTEGGYHGASGFVQQVEDFGPAGSLAATFDAKIPNFPDVQATAMLPDGRMIIAGTFSTVAGAAHQNIARLNADGTVDPTFTARTNDEVECVAVQADGKLVIAGEFTSVNGSAVSATTGVNRIARLNADGTRDTSFDVSGGVGLGGANDEVTSVAIQADGKLVLGGFFTSINRSAVSPATGVNYIARLNADGTRDTSFNTSGGVGLGGTNYAVLSVAVQADGKLVLGGYFRSINGSAMSPTTGVNGFARLNADGTRDMAFNTSGGVGLGGAENVRAVAVQADGRIVLCGYFNSVNGSPVSQTTGVNYVARLNADGTRDTSFNTSGGVGLGGANAPVFCMVMQADGKIVLGGDFTSINGSAVDEQNGVNCIARLNPDGTRDTAFSIGGSGPNSTVEGLAVQADGKLVLAGAFDQVNGLPHNALVRLNNDAALQTLTAPDTSQVLWMRGGAGPELSQVTFELSTDGGANYTLLPGTATRIGTTASWQLSGLVLPASGQLRARGRATDGDFVNGSGLIEQVAKYIAGPDVAPPETAITSGPAALTNSRSAIITFFGTDDVTPAAALGFEGKLDDGAYGSVTSPVILTLLGDGAHTYTVRAKDAAGNPDATPATITWTVDATAPALRLPGPITIEATGAAGAVVNFSAGASDAGSGVASSSFSPASGSTFAIGTTTVNASATDQLGNTVVGSFTVSVTDTTPPLVTVPENITAEATSPAGSIVNFDVSANDLVDGVRAAVVAPASGSTFAIGTTTVDVSAADSRGNIGHSSFTITVSDTTKPVVTPPANVTAEATGPYGARVNYPPAMATDLAGPVSLAYSKASGDLFVRGTTTVTVTATDAALNVATGSFTVTVEDTIRPTIGGTFTPRIMYAGEPLANYLLQASIDDASGVRAKTQEPPAGTMVAEGLLEVKLTATDVAQNLATTTFTVEVRPGRSPSQALVRSGDLAPGHGAAGGPPDDAKLATFGDPAVDDAGTVVFTATWASVTAGRGTGLCTPAKCLAKVGGTVLGAAEPAARLKTLGTPVIGGGHLAMLASLSGVPVATSPAVLRQLPGGALAVFKRGGDFAPDTFGATFKSFAQVGVSGSSVAFLAQLKPGTGLPATTAATDYGVWAEDATHPLKLLLREGQSVNGKTIKTLIIFQGGNGSPGQGRGWVLNINGVTQVHALVVFTDNKQALLRADNEGHLVTLSSPGSLGAGLPALSGTSFTSYSFPARNALGDHAFLGTLSLGAGGVGRTTNRGIFLNDPATGTYDAIARLGGKATGVPGATSAAGAAFSTLYDPVLGSDGSLAFRSLLAGVKATNHDTLWWQPAGGSLTLLAQEGRQPADSIIATEKWLGFTSLAIASGRGPLFTATVTGGVTGVWATDFKDAPRQLFRTGDTIDGKRLTSFTILKALPGAMGMSRSFNGTQQVVWRAVFKGGSTAIVETTVP